MPIRILTVDDHPLLREGIAAVIEGQSDMQLVGEAANGREALQVFRDCRPDVTMAWMPSVRSIANSRRRGSWC
jgi:chemotaxis response regulator CheB